jgi:hypothetical protein
MNRETTSRESVKVALQERVQEPDMNNMETERLALSPHCTGGQRQGQDIPSPQHRIWDTDNNAHSPSY